ncbi:AAA family ATPase [Klebsiella pneumoniae]|uniref:AAA family ATPase n=1 Tax=Klebsiella pneumoniae TaxID=573 RepID=A0A927HPK5_KLEPN|nr:AAA family ATPase [Klebsiella pneumoniae]
MLPSHHELVLVDMMLAREKKSASTHQKETELELDKMAIIKKAIDQVAEDYDYIILDCPPNINLVTQNAFFAVNCTLSLQFQTFFPRLVFP